MTYLDLLQVWARLETLTILAGADPINFGNFDVCIIKQIDFKRFYTVLSVTLFSESRNQSGIAIIATTVYNVSGMLASHNLNRISIRSAK